MNNKGGITKSTWQTLAILSIFVVAAGAGWYMWDTTIKAQEAVCPTGCQWGCYPETTNCMPEPVGEDYVPFALTNVYMYVWKDSDKDATFGADDVQAKWYDQGTFDFTGPYVDIADNAATSGQIDMAGVKIKTHTCYDVLVYEDDGGTAVYPQMLPICVDAADPERTAWTYTTPVYVKMEGTWAESAADSSTAAFDESGDVVTLNKTEQTVEGCLDWDVTIDDSGSGTVIIDPVLIFREDPGEPLTDSDDIEHIYLSLKTGDGVGFFDCQTGEALNGDVVDYFTYEEPICLTDDGELNQADSATITVKICFPSAEADLGTGDFQMILDDLGDYRAKGLSSDVHAAAEVLDFDIH